jgi:hypothetical protein
MAAESKRVVAREVRDEEAKFFQENGWVKLDSLVSANDATILLARLREVMGADAETASHPAAGDADAKSFIPSFHAYEPLAVDVASGACVDSLFYDFSHSPEIGRVGAKLGGASVRYWVDGALVKMPASRSETGSAPTSWHADIGAIDSSPFDPPHGQMQLWLALADIPYERGTMRFVGPKDRTEQVNEITTEHASDPESSYPILEQMGVLSPQLNMRAGDATVHASATLHSAPPNKSDEPRWVYIVSMFPASARYSGKYFWPVEGVEGLEPGKPFVDHRFPVLA